MNKMISLIKATMTDNMSLFKIKKKDKAKKSGKGLTILLFIIMGFSIYNYASMFLEALIPYHMEHVLFSLFGLIVAILIIMEGIYKVGSLIFNCKDDDMLLSLPIKKSTIVFIRILKFYTFEVLYGSLFLIPAIIAYVTRVSVSPIFGVVSVLAILLLPVIPIAISTVVGVITTATSAKFRNKSIIQIIVSMAALIGILYLSFNMQGLMINMGENAGKINDAISKFYYPAAAYSKLCVNFDIRELFIFIGVNILVFLATIFVISKVYFKINSSVKITQKSNSKKNYNMKVNKPQIALIKKEFKRAINTPVLITNAVFGMVLLVIACIAVAIKFDAIYTIPQENLPFTPDKIKEYVPIILVMLLTFGSLTSSTTSSMISLEGKAFTTLKSLPVKPYTVIMSKVHTAILMMMPFVIISDLIFYIRFKFNIIDILLTTIASILLPFIAELIGILVNLKCPELKADTDAEVVKQSRSANISTMLGFILMMIISGILVTPIAMGCSVTYVLIGADILFSFMVFLLIKRAKGKGTKRFNNIDI